MAGSGPSGGRRSACSIRTVRYIVWYKFSDRQVQAPPCVSPDRATGVRTKSVKIIKMSKFSSDSDDYTPTSTRRFFRTDQKPLHAILGGGKAADILLWKNPKLSAAILIGSTVIWSLFEVGEYNFITLICHISIIAMLVLFIWSSGAGIVDWNPPDVRAITIPESTVRWLLAEINKLLLKFYQISSGKDLKTFFLAIAFLWILSGVGNLFTSLNLLYIGIYAPLYLF
ncbi:Reticulon-like protein B9 [Striga hermonthica]|uniref:Reticulon-like protein n=1 Tax=Striga hermonthica TaxID=68872 RepID=A0A9N7MMZ9_STRHE|nr:Reticulon-like protein B9 [Striga hermonthica]